MKKKMLCVCLLVLVAASMLLSGCGRKSREYREAKRLFNDGEYMEAREIFFDLYALYEYKDCEDMYQRCNYEYGKQLVEEENWSLASSQFDTVNDFEDAQDYLSMCEAQMAYEKLMKDVEEYALGMPDLELVSYEAVSLGGSKYGELFTTGAHFASDVYASFTDNDKMTVFEILSDGLVLMSDCSMTADGAVYTCVNRDRENVLYKDGEEILARLCMESPTSKTITSGDACLVCKGSGSVRYNYGSSDLEAYLSGHDPFTVGECTSCKGKGKSYETRPKTEDELTKTDAQKMLDGTYKTEEEAQAESIQNLIDTFGSERGDWEEGSQPYFNDVRKELELLDETNVLDALLGEWTLKDDYKFTREISFQDAEWVMYYDEEGEHRMMWSFVDGRLEAGFGRPNNTYEVRRMNEDFIVLYSNYHNRAHFILYR